MTSDDVITLGMWQERAGLPSGFSLVVEAFADGAVDIGNDMRRAPIDGLTGSIGTQNVQGEEVQTMDKRSNDGVKSRMQKTGVVHCYVSEEEDDPTFFGPGAWDVYIDPLDGSSGIDFGVPVGSILAVYEHKGQYNDPKALLRPGREMFAAAYVLYGSCTTLVIAIVGHGVQGFTLDPASSTFILSHADITYPDKVTYVSINWPYQPKWETIFELVMKCCLFGIDELSGRYIGGLVPDFHRNLLAGGVFFYPGEKGKPEGKLRLLYEVGPISFIATLAGGRGSNGSEDVLDLIPTSLHQRTPVIIGSEAVVIKFQAVTRILQTF